MDRIRISRLCKMAMSPMHYKHGLDVDADSPAFVFGRLVHSLVLLGHHDGFAESPYASFRTKLAREWRAEQAPAGRVVIAPADFARARSIAEAVWTHDYAREILQECDRYEDYLEWTDRDTGLDCRGQIDAWGASVLLDLKTCADICRFERDIHRYHYYAKMAWYQHALDVARGVHVSRVFLIAIEKPAPHSVGVFELSRDYLALGTYTWRTWLRQLSGCLRKGQWPGPYPTDSAVYAEPPTFLERKFGVTT